MSYRPVEFRDLTVRNTTNLTGKTFVSHLVAPSRNFRVELFNSQLVPRAYTNFTQIMLTKILSNSLDATLSASTLILKENGTYAITASIAWEDDAANTREVVVQISDLNNVPQYTYSCSTNVFGFQDLSTVSATLYLPAKWRISVFGRQCSNRTLEVLNTKSTFLEVNRLV